MSNKYLEKIAREYGKDDAVAGLAAGYGAKFAHTQYAEGNLTGRKTLYHGSSESATNSIRRKGLSPSGSSGNTISKMHGLHDANEGLVFTTKSKFQAHTYAAQQENIDKGLHKPLDRKSTVSTLKSAAKNMVTGNDKGISKINLPDWKPGLGAQVNPEYTRWSNSFEGRLSDNLTRKAMKDGLQDSVHIVKDGIGTEYIKGSGNYKSNSASEIKDFISNNKTRFAKGVGKFALGASAALGGVAYLKHKNKTNVSN